jgi:hypothetical protein
LKIALSGPGIEILAMLRENDLLADKMTVKTSFDGVVVRWITDLTL